MLPIEILFSVLCFARFAAHFVMAISGGSQFCNGVLEENLALAILSLYHASLNSHTSGCAILQFITSHV
jgi:hypothetical protein